MPTDFGIPYQPLDLTTDDNVRLRCYLLPQRRDLSATNPEAAVLPTEYENDDEVRCCTYPVACANFELLQFIASRPTVIMFHGNGGNHGHRIPLAKMFFMKMRCNVLMLSYRGFVRRQFLYDAPKILALGMGCRMARRLRRVRSSLDFPQRSFYDRVLVGLQIDSQTALNYVLSDPNFSRSPLVRSLIGAFDVSDHAF